MRISDIGTTTEQRSDLDPLVARLDALLPDTLAEGRAREVLGGAWLGHALHPLLTDFPLGAWTSATLLDLVRHRRARGAVQLLTGFGILASLPTALTGASEWKATRTHEDRRTGAVHAAVNSAALVCYTAAWWTRRRHHALVATGLGLLGGVAASIGGYYGGHLSMARGVGVATSAELTDRRGEAGSAAAVASGGGREQLAQRRDEGVQVGG
jgi:uncharacterized membrane protein